MQDEGYYIGSGILKKGSRFLMAEKKKPPSGGFYYPLRNKILGHGEESVFQGLQLG